MVATTEQSEHLRQLEKANRILQRKLERAERTRRELEATNEKKESLLRKIIQELRDSEASLAERQQTITNLKAAQSQLVQTEKMSSLGQLVAGIAHEINNPINFVWGNIQYVEEYATDLLRLADAYQESHLAAPPTVEEILDEMDLDFMQADFPQLLQSMRLGAERIREIVVSLRNFSRLDEATQKAVDLHEGINNTLLILGHRLKANAEHPGIQVIKDYGDLPLVECYPGQLNQVFMNLLANAIDACEETNTERTFEAIATHPNQITIQTQQLSPESVQIKITDNGAGIASEVRDRLFEPFFTTKPVGKGTGLGLSISYQIVTQKHHGQLDCESIVGEGTTFIMTLPLRLPT